MKKIKSVIALLLCAAMLFAFASCAETGKSGEGRNDKLKVVCTMFPPYDFVKAIAGDKVELTLLVPPGVESHSYDPTPKDMKNVAKADLVIRVNEDMETWSDSLFSEDLSEAKFLDIAKEMGLTLAHHHHHSGEEQCDNPDHNHGSEGADAHIWTDPVMAGRMVEVIAKTLCELDPENADFYSKNLEAYSASLSQLDNDIKETVESSRKKTLVFSGRFAFKNFTERYGLNYVSTLDACADNSEPSAASVAKIVDIIENEKIKVIFFEELIEPKTARTISAETGTKMLLFHSCHNLTKEEFDAGETYLSLMNQNLKNLKEALA